jgi:co-chaperonin GroES (HSP10)
MAMENPFDQKIGYKFKNKIKKIHPLHDHVIIDKMNFGSRTLSSGIVLMGDDGKADGIRPRWAQVYAVGPDQKEILPGQWVLIEHGRWTRGVEVEIDGIELTLRRADTDCIIGVQDEEPDTDDIISTAVDGEKKSRFDYANA